MSKDNIALMNRFKSNPEEMEAIIEQANRTTEPIFDRDGPSNKRVYTPKKVEERVARYKHDAQTRKDALKKAIPFIGKEFDGVFSLTRGLILVVAKSGHAKSTTAANVLAYFLENDPNGTAIAISNEDTGEAVFNRISCAMQRKSFVKYHKGHMTAREEAMVEELVPRIAERVEVIDDGAWNMTVLEDVISVLEYAANKGVSLVVLDYLQTVNTSTIHPEYESVKISKMLGFYLKEYGKKVTVPVVVFAQLKPVSESPDIMSRIQNDKTIYNHAFAVVEIMPDFKARTTNFVIHKDRFGLEQGRTIAMRFVDGRYESLDCDI